VCGSNVDVDAYHRWVGAAPVHWSSQLLCGWTDRSRTGRQAREAPGGYG
jgi:hypothetical protein